jgi:hypothetical protein
MRNGMRRLAKTTRVIPLDLRLRAIADNVPTSSIDELWVFPPLPSRDVACEFLVLICYDGGEDRRRILTAHVDARRPDPDSDDVEWVQRLREHGTAPHDWVTGMPDRLLQRLSEAGVPEVIPVGGRAEAWEEAVARYANGDGGGPASGGVQIDSGPPRGISFSTVNETAASGNGAHIEAGS